MGSCGGETVCFFILGAARLNGTFMKIAEKRADDIFFRLLAFEAKQLSKRTEREREDKVVT